MNRAPSKGSMCSLRDVLRLWGLEKKVQSIIFDMRAWLWKTIPELFAAWYSMRLSN